ncbi:hypothetical protein ABTK08_20205, partial [Acinetobacter baumannii]
TVYRALAGMALLGVMSVIPAPAMAAPEEIQVYIDDLDSPGEVGLDTHINYTATGASTRGDYQGAEDSLHRLRITPEFSLGLTRHLEAGL